MDLLNKLDRVLLRAEIRESGLLDTIRCLFEGTREEQVDKISRWLDKTQCEISGLLEIKGKLDLLIEGLADNRADRLVIKSHEAGRRIEQKQYLMEIVESRSRQASVIQPLSIPKRRKVIVEDAVDCRLNQSDDLGQSFLCQINSIS